MSKSMRRNTMSLIVTLALILCILPALAIKTEAASSYTVSGTVTYAGLALPGVSVIVFTSDGLTQVGSVTTNASGSYSISLDEGEYKLSVNALGNYYETYIEEVTLNSNINKNITLIKTGNAPDYLITENSGTYCVNGATKGTFVQALAACTADLKGDATLKINFGAPGGSLNLPETTANANNLISATYTGSVAIKDASGTSTLGLKIPTGITATFDGLKIVNNSVSVTTNYYMVSVSGNLAINGSTEINANFAKSTAIYVGTGGTLTVNSGLISSGASAFCINGSSCGAITINGGTITASYSNCIGLSKTTGHFTMSGGEIKALASAVGISNSSTKDLILNNCVISSENSYAVYNSNSGNVNINNCTISSKASYAVYNANIGNVIINGATISSGGNYTVYNNNTGNVTMNSGTVTNSKSNGGGIFSDIYSPRTSCGDIRINGGTITAYACITAEGKLFITNDTENPTLTSASGTAISCTGSSTDPLSPALKISAGTITGGNYAVFYNGAGLTQILGGTFKCTVKSKAAVVNNNIGTMEISDGTFTTGNTSCSAVQNNSTGTIKISNGTFTTANASCNTIANNNLGTINILGGSFSTGSTGCNTISNNNKGTINISGGSFATGGTGCYAVSNSNTGTIKITNGTFSTAFTSSYAVANRSTGTIEITGGSISTASASSYAVSNTSSGTINIAGASITAGGGINCYALYNTSTGTINISSGTVSIGNASCNAVYNNSTGKITITGGTFSADFANSLAVLNRVGGTVEIGGGTFSAGSNCVRNDSSGIINITGGSFTSTGAGTGAIALTAASNGHISVSGDSTQLKSTDARTVILAKSTAGDDKGYVDLFGTLIYSHSKGQIYVRGISESGKNSVNKSNYLNTSLYIEGLVSPYKSFGWTSDSARTAPLSISNGAKFSVLNNTANTVYAKISANPTVAINSPLSVSATEETLNAGVNPNGSNTTVSVQYGLTTSYGSVADGTPKTLSGTSTSPITCALTGLTPGKTYHYRFVCVNSSGTTNSTDNTFTTDTFGLSINSSEASITEDNLDSISLTLTLKGTSFKDSTLDKENFTLNNAPAGTAIESVSYTDNKHCTINLMYDSTYFDTNISNFSVTLKALELNGGLELTSNELTISATAIVYGATINTSAADITEENLNSVNLTLTLSGTKFKNYSTDPNNENLANIANFSLNSPWYIGIKKIKYTNPTQATVELIYDGTDFDTNISHFSITIKAAELYSGLALTSSELTISATNETVPVIDSASLITSTSTTAQIKAAISSTGGEPITAIGFVYSSSDDPTLETGIAVPGAFSVSGPQTGEFTASLSGLKESTSYNVRAYATNSIGTSYGSTLTITTADTYSIKTISDIALNDLSVGYATPEAKEITITRTGTGVIHSIAVALSGDEATSFILTQPAATTLNSTMESTTFTIKPKEGLEAGTYTATVTVSGDTIPSMSFTVTQVIKPTVYYAPIPSSDIVINGSSIAIGTYNTAFDSNGRVTKTVTLDSYRLENVLTSLESGATIAIPVSGNVDVAAGILTGQSIVELKAKNATIILQTDSASYTLPASEIDMDSITKQFGTDVSLSDIKVTIQISNQNANSTEVILSSVRTTQYSVLIPAVDFTVSCEYHGITVDLNSFDGYVERQIAIPAGVDPSSISTAVAVNLDGTTYPVPTQIASINGKYYAKIKSMTNSTYKVVSNPIEFSDIENHWSKDAVNDMGSRMIVNGDGSGNYNPDKAITRAEFAAIIVRAMGLSQGKAESGFTDVSLADWFSGYVDTAIKYGIIKGYEDSTFCPNENITREQAMTMLSRAMKVTHLNSALSSSDAGALLSSYTDCAAASSYAAVGIAECIKTGVVTGTSENTVSPKSFVTRAEVAVMVSRLLQKSGLI